MLPDFIKINIREMIIRLLKLPKVKIELPILEKCPYDGLIKYDCEGCEKYIGTPFCQY